jgi:alpha/beta hydrolase fold
MSRCDAAPVRRSDRHANETTAGSVLTAGLTLRIGGRRLNGRVYWPEGSDATGGSALVFVPALAEAGDSDPLCRLLCSAAVTVVITVPGPRGTDDDYELAALEWAVEHAADLGAQSEQLIVAGEGTGGAHAAGLAIRARDSGWPRLRRQILVYPSFTQTCPMPFLLTGVAPATVISSDKRTDDGSTYATRLRASDIEVDVLRCSSPILPGHDVLSAALAGRKG